MRKIDVINAAINLYRNISSEIDGFVSEEIRLLSSLREELEWQLLSGDEKQGKRKSRIEAVKKVITESTKDEFQLEICVIEEYDALQSVLDKIDNLNDTKKDLVLGIRLKAMLFVEKTLLNEHLNAFLIRDDALNLLHRLLLECQNNSELKELELTNLIETVIRRKRLLKLNS
jgi:hypothetical protein